MADTKLQVQLSGANAALEAKAALQRELLEQQKCFASRAAFAAKAALQQAVLCSGGCWRRLLMKQRHGDAASLEYYPAVLAKAAGAFGSTYSAYYYLLGKLWSLYYRIVTYNT